MKKQPYRDMNDPKNWPDSWRSGRSTAIALRTIADCYDKRGEWIKIMDHHGTKEADRHLAREIHLMIGELRFLNFEQKHNDEGFWIRLPKKRFCAW